MPYALSLLLDDEAAVAIREQWDRLAADGLLAVRCPTSAIHRHVTLVVCERLRWPGGTVLDGMIRRSRRLIFH